LYMDGVVHRAEPFAEPQVKSVNPWSIGTARWRLYAWPRTD